MRRGDGDDPAAFGERWRRLAHSWSFDRVNELIHQHNEYYPIERDLPVDPRTGDYVTVTGRPYRREPVGPEWILERFPAPARGQRLPAAYGGCGTRPQSEIGRRIQERRIRLRRAAATSEPSSAEPAGSNPGAHAT